ncbi:MAG: hypothetical protein R3C31_08460 [Hyphomonadaceae bacterium]
MREKGGSLRGFDQQQMTHERLACVRGFEQEPALALTVRVLRGDGAGLAEEREVIQSPRSRPEDGWRVSDGGGGGGLLRGMYGWGEGHRIDWRECSDFSLQFLAG